MHAQHGYNLPCHRQPAQFDKGIKAQQMRGTNAIEQTMIDHGCNLRR
jgi:hypothetical protein